MRMMCNDVQADNTEAFVHRQTSTTSVAGYCNKAVAVAAPGQPVRLLRELDKPAAANAVVVCNADGLQLGYLPRQIAALYAELVDQGLVRLFSRPAPPGNPAMTPPGQRSTRRFVPEFMTTRLICPNSSPGPRDRVALILGDCC